MRMTDDTGLLEHADGVLPRRKEGYSTDDQARALWVCLEFFDLGEKYYHQTQEELLTLMDTYLSYLMWVQEEDGHFHNNIAYDRSKEQEQISEDCLGRCLWACALAAEKLPDDARKAAAKHLLFGSLKAARQLTTLRGMAYTMAALSVGYETLPESERSLLRHLAFRMADQYKACRRSDWFWPEPSVTYGNGVIPWGMLRAYRVLADDCLLQIALEQLDFLIACCTNERGQICPVGNKGWYVPGRRAHWDQQPLDVMKLALASFEAYDLTGREQYKRTITQCHHWFYGDNERSVKMADPEEGSSCDGLSEDGPNQNRGAESTISYLLTEAIYHRYLTR